MNAEHMTTAIIIAAIVVLIMWDIYVAFFNDISNRRDTISGQVLRAALAMPSVGFAVGVLGVHLLNSGDALFGQPTSVIVLGVLGGGLKLVGIRWKLHPLISGALGVLAGFFLWPQ